MPLASLPNLRNPRHLWTLLVTAASAGLAVTPWFVSFGPVTGEPGGLLAATAVTSVPGILMLKASRQGGVARGLRLALLFLGVSMLMTAFGNLLRFFALMGVPFPSIPGMALGTTLLIWATGLMALFLLPLMPMAQGTRWRIATDIMIAGIGMTLVIFVVWTLPGLQNAPVRLRQEIMMFNLMAAGNVLVLNTILVRGPLREIRRAVWWLSATAVIETVYLVSFQYGIGRIAPEDRLTNSLFFVDYLAYFYAAQAFLSDTKPGQEIPLRPFPAWSINLLPAAAVIGVGALLIISALHGSQQPVIVLAAGIVVMTLLLMGRVTVSTAANIRSVQRKAAEDRQAQAEKMDLVARLSGNMAQVIHGLVAEVRGHADQLRTLAWQNLDTSAGFQGVGEATRKASVLAERLLLASGHGRSKQRPRRLGDVVRQQQEPMNRLVGDKRIMIWELAQGAGSALVAPSDLETIMRELVSNAGEATFHGGKITIRVREEKLTVRPPGIWPRPAPGLYSVLEVADTGRGFDEDDLPHVLEPFFTRKAPDQGRGLGLSVVHGIAARYGGGLQIETVPGMGSSVRVYLQAAETKVA